MTVTTTSIRTAPAPDAAAFRARLAPLLEAARHEAVDRERSRTLLTDRIAELQALGFGAVRLPESRGGLGWSLHDVFETLIAIAEADSNLAHVYRGHIAFVEGILIDGGQRLEIWAPRIAAGQLVGNAQSERQELTELGTTLTRRPDGGFRLDGRKYYTTGSIYADWIYLAALEDGERVGVTVSAHQPGVTSTDDWDGFGQQLTGSGTTVFDGVEVAEADVDRIEAREGFRSRYHAALFQTCLLAVVAGIAGAIVRDTVEYVRPRRRIFGQPGEALPKENELVQAVVGELAAAQHTARSLVLASADELDRLDAAWRVGADVEQSSVDAMLNVFKTQQVVLKTVLAQAGELFEVGGASAVGRGLALDRHWRNVRTIASHNPVIHRTRAVGDFLLNGRAPRWGKAQGEQDATEAGR
jgi:alkylation response protein AidB-like acyl-CoA dehydrogenase